MICYACQQTPYDDSSWNGNVKDATLECTCVSIDAKLENLATFCIVNFDTELERRIFRMPTVCCLCQITFQGGLVGVGVGVLYNKLVTTAFQIYKFQLTRINI